MRLNVKCVVRVFLLMIVAIMLPIAAKVEQTFATEKFSITQIVGQDGNEYKIYFTSDELPTDRYSMQNIYAYLSSDNGANWIKAEVEYDENCYYVWPEVEDPDAKERYRDVLTPSTIYQMYVVNQNGEQSETIEVATGISFDPDEDDTKEYKVNVKNWTKNTCTITWDAVEGANGYLITTYDEKDNMVELTTSATTSCTIKGKTLPSWKKNSSEMLMNLEDICVYPYFQFNDLRFVASYKIGSVYPVFQPSKPVVTWDWSSFRKLIQFSIKTNYSDDDTAAYAIECYDLKTGKKVPAKKMNGYCITDTQKDRIYKFRVKQAYKNKSDGKNYYTEWSNYIYALPEAVSDAQRTTSGNIKVTWNKVNKVTGYDIYVKKGGSKKAVKVASVGKNKTAYTIKNVNGTAISKSSKYDIYVVSKKKVGKKTYVSERNFGTTVY